MDKVLVSILYKCLALVLGIISELVLVLVLELVITFLWIEIFFWKMLRIHKFHVLLFAIVAVDRIDISIIYRCLNGY